MGLASSTRRSTVLKHLEQAGFREDFSVIVTGDMVEHDYKIPACWLQCIFTGSKTFLFPLSSEIPAPLPDRGRSSRSTPASPDPKNGADVLIMSADPEDTGRNDSIRNIFEEAFPMSGLPLQLRLRVYRLRTVHGSGADSDHNPGKTLKFFLQTQSAEKWQVFYNQIEQSGKI